MSTIIKYFKDSFQEFNHISWPTRQQAIRLSILTITFLIASSIFIGAVDFLFVFILNR